jgi:hypothetical protein
MIIRRSTPRKSIFKLKKSSKYVQLRERFLDFLRTTMTSACKLNKHHISSSYTLKNMHVEYSFMKSIEIG